MKSSKPAKLPMHLGAYVVRDKKTVAEIAWALKMIESDYSGKSVDGKQMYIENCFKIQRSSSLIF